MFAIDPETLDKALLKLQKLCLAEKLTIACAESCTGGLLSAMLTHLPGCSDYYLGSLVAYANHVKTKVLGVPQGELDKNGAVSVEVARSMALRSQKLFGVDYACSITGVAGPGGGSPEKPVGMICFGWATPESSFARTHQLKGSREDIRAQACLIALTGLLDSIVNETQKEIP